jgi:diguanylate cyclase (GGDEF)-like protein
LTRRLVSAAAILFASILAGSVVAQAPLTVLTAVRQLNNAGAGKGLLIASETAVTHFRPDRKSICVIDGASPFVHDMRSKILPRSPEVLAVLAGPGWQNARNLTQLAWVLLIVVLAAGVRGWYLEHKTRRQIGSLAYVEQRRSRILEDINHSEPLAGILERITELVSVRLNGAPCWCRIADGATLGNRPALLTSESLRTVEHPIDARSGPPLGAIFAAFHSRTKPSPAEKEALAMAAGLATLAIETSRLYSDLVHRSEFDLLTDVPNRFAMEKALDAMIRDARQSAGIFGLIYIDLNEFKQVNDAYGHQAGDLYLQEMVRRMKRQLRPGDTLARLGGDEFAVLVSEVRNRAEVQEIATRLECCFEEPFMGEGYVVHGSASIGIALYPGDATTRDGLLSSADNAMYKAKYTRMEKNRAPQAQSEDQFAPKKQAQETARLAPGPTNH